MFMGKEESKYQDINSLLNNILSVQKDSLQSLFDKKINELNISFTNSAELLEIQPRALKAILEGSKKILDITNLIKIANFLLLPKDQVINLYLDSLENHFSSSTIPAEKIKYIKENFDLAGLKKAGFITSITDFDEIDYKITNFLGLKSIFEYQRPNIKPAFSAGLIKPKNELNRSLWIKSAIDLLEELNNPNDYDRNGLIEYFSNIRWHSMNVKYGLTTIIRDLFKLGITVVYHAPLPALHLRGATFAVNEKPCIVLTNYVGFYGTLWFALIHELYHVLFDWDEIKEDRYHITDEDPNELMVIEKEEEANNFAREYLLPKENMDEIRFHMNDPYFIEEYAKSIHLHPSIIYIFYAYESNKGNRVPWARARKNEPSDMKFLIESLSNPWDNYMPIKYFAKKQKMSIYN